MDIFQFTARLRGLSAPEDCKALYHGVIAEFGFDTFACGELDMRERARNVFYLIDWPPEWQRFYASSGFIERDPIVDALAYRKDPFTWSDLRADRKLAKAGRQALDLVAAAGWTEGLVIPLPQGGNRMGLVSLVGHAPVAAANRDFLCLAGISLHNHVRTLLPATGFAMPPAGLTDREITCLRLVVQGLPDAGIAEDMGIAKSTAHEFVEKAKRRLNARSRAELAAVAVGLGIVAI